MDEPYEHGRLLFEAVRKDVAPNLLWAETLPDRRAKWERAALAFIGLCGTAPAADVTPAPAPSRADDTVEGGQKARWLRRAEQRETWAAAAESRASQIERSLPDHARDPAFMTQPGAKVRRIRDKLTAREQLAWSLRQKAAAHRETAANLRGLAGRNKGDAEAARQRNRDQITKAVRAGDFVDCIYGIRRVLKVNDKTLRLEGSLEPIVVDKALCTVVPVCCGACASWRKPTPPETEGECWSADRLDNEMSGPADYTLPTSGCEAWWPKGFQPRPDGVDSDRP